MNLSYRSAISLFAITAIFTLGVHGQTILNGDLEGPPTVSSAAPSWFNWQKTPDTCDANGPFNNTPNPWVLSPNGGTFVRTAGSSGTNSEAFAQNVTDFVPGVTYEISFYQTNLGFEHPTSGAWTGTDGFYDILIDGALAGSSPTLTKPVTNNDPNEWSLASISFVAPSAAFELAFVAQSASSSGLAAYMGIDGISARVVSVPTPGALVCLAIPCLAAQRRHRRATI